MIKIVVSILIIICFTSCSQSINGSKARVLTYEVSLQILNDTIPKYAKDYLNQKYGDSVQITYDSFGNIRMDYFGSGQSGMSYNMYNAKKHIMYAKWKNLDTLYYYDASVNKYSLDSTQRVNTTNGFILKYYAQNPNIKGNTYQEFHFLNDSLAVNPELYKDFKDFSFGDIIAESKSLPIKNVMMSEDIKLTRKLISVRTIENPKKSFFSDNKTFPLKHY